MSTRERLFLTPVEKFVKYGIVPFKLILNSILVALVTIQVRPFIHTQSGRDTARIRGRFSETRELIEAAFAFLVRFLLLSCRLSSRTRKRAAMCRRPPATFTTISSPQTTTSASEWYWRLGLCRRALLCLLSFGPLCAVRVDGEVLQPCW